MSSSALPAPAKQLFHYLFEQASLGIAVENLEGQLLLANPALCSMLGYTEQELCSMSCSQFASPEDSEDDWAHFEQLRAGIIDRYSLEKRYIRKDGTRLWGQLNVSLLKDADGGSPVVFAFVEEITERKQAEERLREYEKAVEGSEDIIAVVDREYRYVIANRRFLKLRNLTKEQVIGHRVPEVLNPGVFEAIVKEKLDECFTGKVVKYEMKYTYPRLGERDVFVSYFPIDGVAGVDRAVCILQDITERKRAEEALKKSEEKFSKAFRESPMALTLTSAIDHRYLEVNETFEQITGWRRDEVIGRTPPDIGIWVDPNQRLEFVKRVLAEGAIRGWEVHYRSRDGTLRVGLGAGELIQIGSEPCILSVIADITERKRVEEALGQREVELTDAQRLAGLGSWQWDARIDEVIWSKELYRIAGRDPRLPAPTYKEHPSLYTPESWERLQGAVKEALQTGAPYELDLEMLNLDSTTKWGIARGEPLRDTGGPIIGLRGTFQDVTERKRVEEALRESEDKLRLLLDSTAEAIYGIDLEHRCTFCNPAFIRVLGYEHVDDVLGKNVHRLVHHTRADGTLFPVEECQIHHFQTGEGAHAEDELFWRANGTSFPVEYWSYPQWKGQEVVGAVVSFIDITDRKLAEAALANVSRKLIEAQEQERTRIGRELHDDVGQRLALLAVELQQLQENSAILPEVRSRVGELNKQTSEIAADVQSLSHELHSAKLQYLGIVSAVRGFCREFGEQQKVQIDFESHDLPGKLSADVSLCLFRVLQEALHNSAKHSGVRHFEVRLWGTPDEIHLTVGDSGAGFDREAARMSQGLGLISMEERLKLVNGTLSIESAPKGGTTIHARAPVDAGGDSMRAAG
jgi:PAS domain S-box-containing protein